MNQTWTEFVLNPEAIAQLYSAPPALAGIEVIAMRLWRDGPGLEITAILTDVPDIVAHVPERWKGRPNAVCMSIDFWAIDDFSLRGWATRNCDFTLSLSRVDETHSRAVGASHSLNLEFIFRWARISAIHLYERNQDSIGA